MILFGFPWLYGLVFGGTALGHVNDPSDIPMSVHCWGSITEPGTMAFFIVSVVAVMGGLILTTALVCCSMFSLIRVRESISI